MSKIQFDEVIQTINNIAKMMSINNNKRIHVCFTKSHTLTASDVSMKINLKYPDKIGPSIQYPNDIDTFPFIYRVKISQLTNLTSENINNLIKEFNKFIKKIYPKFSVFPQQNIWFDAGYQYIIKIIRLNPDEEYMKLDQDKIYYYDDGITIEQIL